MSAAFGRRGRQCASDRDASVAGAPNPVARSQTGWSKRNFPQILTAYSIVSAPGAPQDEALVTPRRCKAGPCPLPSLGAKQLQHTIRQQGAFMVTSATLVRFALSEVTSDFCTRR